MSVGAEDYKLRELRALGVFRFFLPNFFFQRMCTTETPGDLQFLCPDAPRHIVLAEHLQRQRVMIVGDIHGHIPPVCACVLGIHAFATYLYFKF
jgi:hypothetical protein